MRTRIRRRWGAGPTGGRQSSDGERARNLKASGEPVVSPHCDPTAAPSLRASSSRSRPPATAAAATPGLNLSLIDNQGNPYVRDPGMYPGDPTDSQAAWRDIDASGAKTLRTFVLWNAIDDAAVGRYSLFVQHARAHGMAVRPRRHRQRRVDALVARGVRPRDGRLAGALRGTGTSYEIWNEPDWPTFWQGAPQPADYAAVLKAAYTALKGADPEAKVISGGLVGNDFDFLDAASTDHGAKGSFDAVGVHTDTACNLTIARPSSTASRPGASAASASPATARSTRRCSTTATTSRSG